MDDPKRQICFETSLAQNRVAAARLTNQIAGLLQYAQAERLFKKEINSDRRILGNDHPDALGNIHNLALLFLAQGKDISAALLFKQAWAMRFYSQGQYAQAEPFQRGIGRQALRLG